jgi:phosphoglycolate phosphatase
MTAVFLDLDGTLMDSRPGILASLGHAFGSIGRRDIADGDLTWMIGPPFIDSFQRLGIDDPQPALDAYRVHYTATGMYDAQVFAGIPLAMDALRASGFRLYLATAKPHDYARKITAHFGLAEKMIAEFGPELDGTHNWKGDLLAYALRETGEDPARSVMVGDRHHDMAAAAEVGMASIAARWGYGEAHEWQGAASEIDTPGDLFDAVAAILR